MKPLPPPQLNLGPEPFALLLENTQDGDAIIMAQQQREADKLESERFQRRLQFEGSHTV